MTVRPDRVTLSDVAKEANVSVATASKVLNGRPGVGDETRKMVRQVASRIGYVSPFERERPQVEGRESFIEVLVQTIESPYLMSLLSGIIAACGRNGISVVVSPTENQEPDSSLPWAQSLARGGRIGVIETTSAFSMERSDSLRKVGLPLVLVDPVDVPATQMYSVGASNFSGGQQATRHLLEGGHRTVAFIGGLKGSSSNVARFNGFRAALEEVGIEALPAYVRHGGFDYETGLAQGLKLLTLPEPPTAVFCASDAIALGLLEAARMAKVSVPLELSVVGFDNTILAQTSSPGLTTVHQPIFEIGQSAAELTLKLARGELVSTHRTELSTHLVLRDSTTQI